MSIDQSLDRIRKAAEILATRDAVLKERLTSAGQEFWSGTYYYDDWPKGLQEQADTIIRTILEKGTVETTVRQMDRTTAQETARKILQFMVDFELVGRDREEAKSRLTGE